MYQTMPMALGIATRRATEGDSVSEAMALIEGREALGGHRLDRKGLRYFACTQLEVDLLNDACALRHM
jgi:hypothetical protein